MIQVAYVLVWWLALAAIGLVSFPLVSRICGSLPDKGYFISKLVGLVILTFFGWLLPSLHIAPFGYVSLFVALALLVALSLFVGRKNLRPRTWPWKHIVIGEAIFTGAFVVFLLVAMGRPDIYFTGAGDAFFNFAFIKSILRAEYFPPADPWFAGGAMPYYYGGHTQVALLTLGTRVPPAIAFNVAGAMYHALAVAASYGLGYSITKRKLYGFLAALFVCILGYASGALQLMAYGLDRQILDFPAAQATSVIDWMLWFDFWSAPWLLAGALVHYPYLSFVLGDMHSYMVSIPFQVMFIALIFALFQRSRLAERVPMRDTALYVFVLAVCLGFFFILNTWEYATYTGFIIAAFILLKIRSSLKGNLIVPAAVIGLSFLLYIPHYLSGSVGGLSGIGVVATRTTLAQLLEYGVLFLFATCSLLFLLGKREVFRGRVAIVIGAAVLVVSVVAAVLLDFYVLIVVVPVTLLALYYVYRHRPEPEMRFALLLLLMSVGLVFFCDVFYANDALGGEWERFNTVLKLYLQLWVFWGLAATYAMFYVVKNIGMRARIIWVAVAVVLIVACLVHPVASTVSMVGGRQTWWDMNRGTLDGAAYIEMVDKGDYDAIGWINEEIEGSPVILEANEVSGVFSVRVSTFTGLPTVIGGWGETMWRYGSEADLGGRTRDVEEIYNTNDNETALQLLGKYDVEYIYIGTLERETYESDGLAKFGSNPDDYELVYESEGVSIFEVRQK